MIHNKMFEYQNVQDSYYECDQVDTMHAQTPCSISLMPCKHFYILISKQYSVVLSILLYSISTLKPYLPGIMYFTVYQYQQYSYNMYSESAQIHNDLYTVME